MADPGFPRWEGSANSGGGANGRDLDNPGSATAYSSFPKL